MKSSLLLSLFSVAVALVAATAPVPFETSSPRTGDVIPGRFIVQLAPGVSPETIEAHHHQVRRMLRRKRGEDGGNVPAGVGRVFGFGDFHSYSAGLDDLTAADIARLPDVLSVEPDVVIRVEPSGPGAAPNDAAHDRRAPVTQTASPWHLGDISHAAVGATEYVFDGKAGEGNTIYIVDSGIRSSHEEFGGRVRFGINGITGSTTPPSPDEIDSEGHGTHVASLVAGKTYGVAKKAQLVDCKCFDAAMGSVSALLTTLSWAVEDIIARKAENTSALNLSLGVSSVGWALDQFIVAAYQKGILAVVAAGNDDKPASTYSPGHLQEVITVGMTESKRSRVSRIPEIWGSNYGPEVDIFAPGGNVVAAGINSDVAMATKTGTSMATPIVSGLVAYLRSLESGLDTPEQVRARLIELSWKDVVKDPKGSPNRLLYNGSGK